MACGFSTENTPVRESKRTFDTDVPNPMSSKNIFAVSGYFSP